jgi:DNA-directed RNA polymerase subunit RPC12/RpoP
MKLEVICPACKKEFRFTDRSGLETVPCPHCGDQVPKDLGSIVADEAAQPTQVKSSPAAADQTRRCPECGKPIPIKARKCKHCRAWIETDEEREEIDSEYVPCPRCGARGAERVVFTFWGSFYGPALFTHVQCPKCHYKYNGKTGKSNLIPAIIFVLVPLLLILAVIGGVIALAISLGRGA